MFLPGVTLARLKRRITLLALLFSVYPAAVSAHPHSWVDLQTRINLDQNRISSLSMAWQFDAMTSAYMLSGEKINQQNRTQVLQKLAQEVIENMLSSHYFTYFYQGETPIRYKRVKQAEIVQHGAKLTLNFELELAQPVDKHSPDLSLLIFDPSYFVDMSWPDGGAIAFNKEQQTSCRVEVTQPEPTAEQLAYAMSLPMDADPDNELGKLFTQKAALSCQRQGE